MLLKLGGGLEHRIPNANPARRAPAIHPTRIAGAEPQTRQVKYSRPWLSKRELQLEPETIAEIPVEAIEDGRNDGIVDRTAVHEPHSRQSLS